MTKTRQNSRWPLRKIIPWILCIVVLAIVFANTHPSELLKVSTHLPWWTLPGLILVNVISILTQGIRWWVSLLPFAPKLGVIEAVRLHLISSYYSIALPSGAAVDVARGYLITRHVNLSEAVSSGWMNRLQGLIALLFYSALGLGLLGIHQAAPFLIWAVTGLGFGIFLLSWFSLNPKILGWISNLSLNRFPKISKQVKALEESLIQFKNHKANLFWGQILAIIVQGFSFTSMFVLLLAVTQKFFFIEVLAYTPLIEIASALQPLSPNGLGVREGLNAGFFSIIGLSAAQMSAMLVISLSINALRLIGMPFALVDAKHNQQNRDQSPRK